MAMAQALSEEEFHRMQAQLLELRTQNYQLSDDLRKNSAELGVLRQKTGVLERDLGKAQKALSKSKKAQEVDALLGETAMLQGKLHSQEEDFRLQNSTLMAELSKLCTQIEQLEQDNQRLKEVGGASATSPAPTPVPDSAPAHDDTELLRVQAENSALQNKMAALQERYDQEVQRLSSSTNTSSTSSSGPDQAENGAGEQAGPECGPTSRQILGRSEKVVEKLVGVQAGWSALCPLTPCFGAELEVSLSTEQEEKRLLREHVLSLEASKQTEVTKLLEEVSKLSDRLKKKQESFQRLQGEKEALYNDSRTKIDEINQKKEDDLKSLNLRIQKLQTDLGAANQTMAEMREQLLGKEKEHEVALHTLRDQIQTVKTQEVNLLREQQGALSAELQQKRAEQESLLAQRDDLTSQMQEASFASRRLLEQLSEESQEKERLQRELEDSRKTAEKRKVMLDDVATQLNQEKSGHKEVLSDLKLQQEKEVLAVRARYEKELRGLHEEKNRCEEELKQQLRDEKARSKDLELCQQTVEELQAEVRTKEESRDCLERRLGDAEENIKKNSVEHEEKTENLKKEHKLHLEEKEAEMEGVRIQLTEVEKLRDENGDIIEKLKQDIKDTVEGQRILEKKGGAALKDLKRQLQSERKRADKLQERLQEILTNSKTRTGLEELVLSEISSPSRTQQTGDSSSVSSFSYRDMMKEAQPPREKATGGSPPPPQGSADLSDEEVGELFQRLALVQQDKWMLEEKVKHLEVSCSSMAEDIRRKSAIIETYVHDSRTDACGGAGAHAPAHGERGGLGERMGLGAVLRDLVKPGDENLREMNKKLQNMLEEQLTKNMHLQKDLEILCLSKDGSLSG
ncbi:GRIP1-associated protein 1 isoform X2 [Gadus chalcogrammus]|uniref:GRIP1-associated protein 1 isoform X2 n=1 Tax=Gadus chalcogrammus TaxID=1042646 RepID=UPI0024C467E6|nr:GRIP1-associated protein 1 isoform X2 [Gadus chalcogrammus]